MGWIRNKRTDQPIESLQSNNKLVTMIQDVVLNWYEKNGRDFPWRRTRDPFLILLAEILLRQTQAERISKPYVALAAMSPNAQSMSKANIMDLRNWFKPLGLFRRADNLVKCANILVSEYAGSVPEQYEILLELPGIGHYTASAILCLGYGKAYPMIDEGSGRLLRRVCGYPEKGVAHSDRELYANAVRLMPVKSAEFNYGLLDIAHFYCRPVNPQCGGCPLNILCQYGENMEFYT